ncbi:MAG: pyruvate carboxylase [Planctomycetales bacterium]|nr:pyruvate carboxylase [Planctomycetales bacterium]
MKFKKLLVANRSEIATRVFRSATELGIRTVAIYTHEDRYALHRFKADEAYKVGQQGEPIRAYLDIPGIIQVAKRNGVDAIHPGYGFLSEKPEFARACKEAGITFVGPSVEVLEALGNKTTARQIAQKAGVPILSGSQNAIESAAEGKKLATDLGFPIILKAAHGGGGRGMRVVNDVNEFDGAFEQAQRESLSAFGSDEIFIEKFISRARHIEVQLLGDQHGNLVHLYERDCSVQRRHQKVVEIAPAPNLPERLRDELCNAALEIGRTVNYQNAGTVEFLVDADSHQFYFIEVNPRIQVEHTVTEQVTGVDIVMSQIRIAQGTRLDDDDIGLESQNQVDVRGFAMQCRVTTEDPSNGFLPDYGRISHYRSASGMGVRLDAGSAYSGAVVNPFYDSMLVKVTALGRRYQDVVSRMKRCLLEFRVRGVKTNIPFLIKLMDHETFKTGDCTTRFIDDTPELFVLPRRRDRATRLLTFLGDVIVNGNALVAGLPAATRREPAILPFHNEASTTPPEGSRDRLKKLGPEKFSKWVLDHKPLLFTDTTFRDAHQSLLATRFRTYDLVQIAESYSQQASQLFSIEMWGGATFDTSMRFLKESPWSRLTQLREKIPNVLFQMLLRASNAVGYTNYPDNVVQAFVKEAADAGMDVFRVFDALNDPRNMRVAMDAVLETDAICEASVCYTGDILDSSRMKYDMKYYVNLAKDLEKMGAHILAIKDMAGLCKPEAARLLVKTLKQEIGIPIHFHTHDTAGVQAAAILNAAEVDLDIADAAMAPMSGGTSQPNLNALAEALRFSDRASELEVKKLDAIADYWRSVREFYAPFESQVLPATADLYHHEMPGGQYTNLYQQARALGLLDQWSRVCEVYAQVNQMFGDIVKVTPTSKAVGDMALFMVANELTPDDVLSGDREIAYPASVIDLIGGNMGQPPGGFPEQIQKRVLKDKKPLLTRPGETMAPADFEATRKRLQDQLDRDPTDQDVVSSLLYPKVFEDFAKHQKQYYDPSGIPTHVFFYGMQSGEEMSIEIESGKVLIVKFLTVGEPHPDGKRTVFFEVNGVPRNVSVVDHSLEPETQQRIKADVDDPKQIGSTMPGMVVTVSVKVGDVVKKGEKLLTLEAMKMETSVNSEADGKVAEILVKPGSQVDTGDLLIRME